jgi:cold shock CspA family protein
MANTSTDIQTQTTTPSTRLTGVVKWFNHSGFGFITVCGPMTEPKEVLSRPMQSGGKEATKSLKSAGDSREPEVNANDEASEFYGKDIFVHYSSLVSDGDDQDADADASTKPTKKYKYLIQGEYVQFVLAKATDSKHDHQAVSVTGIFGGKLLCENYPNAAAIASVLHASTSSSSSSSSSNTATYSLFKPPHRRNSGGEGGNTDGFETIHRRRPSRPSRASATTPPAPAK